MIENEDMGSGAEEGIIDKWIKTVKNNPGLTQTELERVYQNTYPNDGELEQKALKTYLKERDKEINGLNKGMANDIDLIKIVLVSLLIISIIGFLGTCITQI